MVFMRRERGFETPFHFEEMPIWNNLFIDNLSSVHASLVSVTTPIRMCRQGGMANSANKQHSFIPLLETVEPNFGASSKLPYTVM